MKTLIRLVLLSCVLTLLCNCLFLTTTTSAAWWGQERSQRQQAIQTYVDENHAAFASFKNAPLAIKQDPLNFVGVQMIMFRLFPVIFPDIWGNPQDQMAVLGFGPDPFEPESVMPLGTGYHLSQPFTVPDIQENVSVNYATLTCMGCHSGQVTKPDGEVIRLVGAPNLLGDFLGTVHRTVNDPRYTAENFRTVLNQEPPGWVYGTPIQSPQEEFERALFNAPGGAEYFLEELKFISNQRNQRIDETLLPYTYNVPNPPAFTGPGFIPGQLDVFSFAAASLFDPSVLTPAQMQASMPAAPAPADIMGVWRQADRPHFQWDDSLSSIVFRETAASLSVTSGDPKAVNQPNLVLSGNFTINLPSAPYPFGVKKARAMRGQRIFEQACQSCHAPGNSVLMAPSETATDPNRAFVFTDNLVTSLIVQLRAGCLNPECFGPGGTPLPDSEILNPPQKYASIPLAGVWATAPYLHNGSVPTLYHLLTGKRPASFYRGNTTYDRKNVGYTWDTATSPQAVLFDTTQAGHSNSGHTGPQFNGGIDWEKEPKMLLDLLAYLKTL
jgi:processive rubber oxygenase RoxA-like protein